jgi:hypothetical protein
MKDTEVFERAIDTWGRDAQTRMFIEEAMEWCLALDEASVKGWPNSNILTESVDLCIMTMQLNIMLIDSDELRTALNAESVTVDFPDPTIVYHMVDKLMKHMRGRMSTASLIPYLARMNALTKHLRTLFPDDDWHREWEYKVSRTEKRIKKTVNDASFERNLNVQESLAKL